MNFIKKIMNKNVFKLTSTKYTAPKNKELDDKIKQEEDALKRYFLRILEENKEYYKKAYYNH